MSGSMPPFRFWEDVEVGEVLARLEFPITPKTMVLAVCGTRDLMPYHHDPAYSKSVGNRDILTRARLQDQFSISLIGFPIFR